MAWDRHGSEHDLAPWTSYFLGILLAAYKEFEGRTGALAGRGSKRELIESFIDSLLVDEFTIADVRQAAPGVSNGYINRVLAELKSLGTIMPLGTGRSARWRRLGQKTAMDDANAEAGHGTIQRARRRSSTGRARDL